MRRSIRGLAFLGLSLATVVGLAGCEWLTGLLHPGGGLPWASSRPIPVASQPIGAGGGVITVDDPGGPLDGMTIEVPSGAYPTAKTFDVSYTPTSGNPSPHLTLLTPLIEIDNGGEFACEVMSVTIPVSIPGGHFAMGFFVDENGDLEGMPLVAETPTSITVATAHFSRFVIGMIADSLLVGTFDTGFRPMTDDWQFTNRGSYIAPNGHCAGQSLTAMWYYVEKTLNGTSTLWNRYDNNGRNPTPDFWYDDSNGYRLASTIQDDIDWDNWLRTVIKVLGSSDDALNWRAFLYAMLITGEPQYVAIYSAAGGHAMIAYKADADTGTLYVADPNYPGHSGRKIMYADGTFGGYESGANRAEIDAGRSVRYDSVRYFAKSALVSWSHLAARWDDFLLETIGDDVFPSYGLAAILGDGSAIPLTDGLTVSDDRLEIQFSHPAHPHPLGYVVYRGNEWLAPVSASTWSLVEGDNRLGIYVLGNVNGSWKYVDFQWVTVHRVAPITVSGRMEFHLAATISQDPQYGGAHAGVVGTTMTFWNGSYDPATKTVTASWDGGHFSDTYFEARLNATEEYIEYFYARQTQANVWFAWTNVHEIRGYAIPYSHTESGSRYFVVDGSQAHVVVDLLKYKTWSTSLGSASNPTEWVSSASALTGDSADIITIRLDN